MTTKVYGAGGNLIEFEGDVSGEVSCYRTDDNEEGVLLVFDDGTLLAVKGGKPGLGGVWSITILKEGRLFERLDICTDEDADPCSDVAHFRSGIRVAYAAKTWERVE